jgi:hypothetical protein
MAFWEAVSTFFKTIGKAWGEASLLKKINYVFTAVTAITGVKGYLQQRNMLAKGQDIMANKTAAGGKLPVIYGTRRVGAQVVFLDTPSNSSQHLFVVYALSVGEVDEILLKTLEIDGNPLTDPNQFRNGGYLGSDRIGFGAGSLCYANQTSGSVDLAGGTFGSNPTLGGYRYVFNAHHGEATQTADPMLTASIGSKWTSAHKLNGVAYIAASFIYDSKGQFSGVPQITVQVKGKKVYDPRDSNQTFGDATTYKWSDNPAVCFLDLISNNEYGKGLTSSQLNMSTFTSAAGTADTLVDQPYYSGVAKTFSWSSTAGDDFIVVDPSGSGGLHWWQNKVGEAFSLWSNTGINILNEAKIVGVERTHYPFQGVRLLIYFDEVLSISLSGQTGGEALAKVRRFQCNGYLDCNKTVMENSKELLANMRGIFLYIDGKYELSIEDTGTSTFSITDDHIIADSGISVDYGNKDKKANKVIVEFFNANKKYELDTATVLHDANPEYYSDDGDEILEIKAEFPFVTDPYIAYNMGKAILVRSRNQTTMQFLGTPEMYKLNVGDIVDLTYTGLGFSGKVCRVEALELQSNGLVAVSLIEYFDVYTWEVPPQEEFEDISDIPSAYAVAAPTNVSFTDTDASSTGRPFITWDLPTDYPYHQWRVNIFKSGFPILQILNKIVDVNSVDLNFIPKGTGYTADISAINSLGIESDPTQLSFNVGDEPTGTDDLQDDAVTDVKVLSLSADKLTAGTIDADVITVTNFTADNISGDIDKLEPISLTPNTSIGTSYTQIGNVVLSAPDITTAGGGHTPFFSLVISATLSGGGAQMDLQGVLTGITTAGGSSPTIYTAAESGQDHNFSSGLISQSLSGSFNTKVFATCSLTLYAKKNTGTITVNKIQGVYAGLRGG